MISCSSTLVYVPVVSSYYGRHDTKMFHEARKRLRLNESWAQNKTNSNEPLRKGKKQSNNLLPIEEKNQTISDCLILISEVV